MSLAGEQRTDPRGVGAESALLFDLFASQPDQSKINFDTIQSPWFILSYLLTHSESRRWNESYLFQYALLNKLF